MDSDKKLSLEEACRRLKDNDKTLDRLDLSNTAVGDHGAVALAFALKKNTFCKELHLGHSNIGSDGAGKLATTLKQFNKCLERLYLQANTIGDAGAESLAKSLAENNSLRVLNVANNGIGDIGAAAFAESLQQNQGLWKFYMYDNEMGNTGAMALAEAVEINTTLQELFLWGNKLGDSGVDALCLAYEEACKKDEGRKLQLRTHWKQQTRRVVEDKKKDAKTKKAKPKVTNESLDDILRKSREREQMALQVNNVTVESDLDDMSISSSQSAFVSTHNQWNKKSQGSLLSNDCKDDSCMRKPLSPRSPRQKTIGKLGRSKQWEPSAARGAEDGKKRSIRRNATSSVLELNALARSLASADQQPTQGTKRQTATKKTVVGERPNGDKAKKLFQDKNDAKEKNPKPKTTKIKKDSLEEILRKSREREQLAMNGGHFDVKASDEDLSISSTQSAIVTAYRPNQFNLQQAKGSSLLSSKDDSDMVQSSSPRQKQGKKAEAISVGKLGRVKKWEPITTSNPEKRAFGDDDLSISSSQSEFVSAHGPNQSNMEEAKCSSLSTNKDNDTAQTSSPQRKDEEKDEAVAVGKLGRVKRWEPTAPSSPEKRTVKRNATASVLELNALAKSLASASSAPPPPLPVEQSDSKVKARVRTTKLKTESLDEILRRSREREQLALHGSSAHTSSMRSSDGDADDEDTSTSSKSSVVSIPTRVLAPNPKVDEPLKPTTKDDSFISKSPRMKVKKKVDAVPSGIKQWKPIAKTSAAASAAAGDQSSISSVPTDEDAPKGRTVKRNATGSVLELNALTRSLAADNALRSPFKGTKKMVETVPILKNPISDAESTAKLSAPSDEEISKGRTVKRNGTPSVLELNALTKSLAADNSLPSFKGKKKVEADGKNATPMGGEPNANSADAEVGKGRPAKRNGVASVLELNELTRSLAAENALPVSTAMIDAIKGNKTKARTTRLKTESLDEILRRSREREQRALQGAKTEVPSFLSASNDDVDDDEEPDLLSGTPVAPGQNEASVKDKHKDTRTSPVPMKHDRDTKRQAHGSVLERNDLTKSLAATGTIGGNAASAKATAPNAAITKGSRRTNDIKHQQEVLFGKVAAEATASRPKAPGTRRNATSSGYELKSMAWLQLELMHAAIKQR